MIDETPDSRSEEAIAALVRLGGRRAAIPEDVATRVRAAVREEWLRERGRRMRTRWLSAAAVAAVVAGGSLVVQRTTVAPSRVEQPPAPQVVAHVQHFSGGAVAVSGARRELLTAGRAVLENESLETAGGASASLEWNGSRLRIGANSRLRVRSGRSLLLDEGVVFIATGANTRSVVVQTPHGEVRDIGTQFEVRVRPDGVRVRVREGEVELVRQQSTHRAGAGMQLESNGEAVIPTAIPTAGPEWDWIADAAPPIRLEGRRLHELVTLVCEELGLREAWSGPIPPSMRDAVLHGDVPLTPREALDAALTATGFTSRIESGRLVITRKK